MLGFARLKFNYILFFTLIFLASCGSKGFGEKAIRGNFELYFTSEINERYVSGILDYYEDNGLILEQKHSAQITSNEESFVLKVIPGKPLNDTVALNLKILEAEIKADVFENRNFKILLCDAFFNPLKEQF